MNELIKVRVAGRDKQNQTVNRFAYMDLELPEIYLKDPLGSKKEKRHQELYAKYKEVM